MMEYKYSHGQINGAQVIKVLVMFSSSSKQTFGGGGGSRRGVWRTQHYSIYKKTIRRKSMLFTTLCNYPLHQNFLNTLSEAWFLNPFHFVKVNVWWNSELMSVCILNVKRLFRYGKLGHPVFSGHS